MISSLTRPGRSSGVEAKNRINSLRTDEGEDAIIASLRVFRDHTMMCWAKSSVITSFYTCPDMSTLHAKHLSVNNLVESYPDATWSAMA